MNVLIKPIMKSFSSYLNPVLLYYYRAKSELKNFGDEVSYFIVDNVLNKTVLKALTNQRFKFIKHNNFHPAAFFVQPTFRRKERLFAIGSILGPKVNNSDIIWGSGFISDKEQLNPNTINVKLLALRGKKTFQKLTETNITVPNHITFGDPGLLISKFIERVKFTENRIVIIPHYIHKDYLERVVIKSTRQLIIIDARDDFKKIANDISGANLVISSSLHGIVFAHSFSVPAIRMVINDENLKGGDFKFEDYMSVYDNDVILPKVLLSNNKHDIDLDELIKNFTPIAPSQRKIVELQDSLIETLKTHYRER